LFQDNLSDITKNKGDIFNFLEEIRLVKLLPFQWGKEFIVLRFHNKDEDSVNNHDTNLPLKSVSIDRGKIIVRSLHHGMRFPVSFARIFPFLQEPPLPPRLLRAGPQEARQGGRALAQYPCVMMVILT
jgi:hypothetical protein